MSTASDLREALDYLHTYGWHKGSLFDHGTLGEVYGLPACGYGACMAVTIGAEGRFMNGHRYDRMTSILFELVNRETRFSCFPIFNDADSTTFEDVAQLFKQAIYEQENQ